MFRPYVEQEKNSNESREKGRGEGPSSGQSASSVRGYVARADRLGTFTPETAGKSKVLGLTDEEMS
jgi:hypothetical protein